MKIKILKTFLVVLVLSTLLTSCFSLKNSPFYDSEWVMQTLDDKGQLYYHHLILSSDYKCHQHF